MASDNDDTNFQLSPVGSIITHVPASGLVVSCDGRYLAATYSRRTEIGLWELPKRIQGGEDHHCSTEPSVCSNNSCCWSPTLAPPMLLLSGHVRAVQVMAFSRGGGGSSYGHGQQREEEDVEVTTDDRGGLLCSVDDQWLMVWNLRVALQQLQEQQQRNQNEDEAGLFNVDTHYIQGEGLVLYAKERIAVPCPVVSHCVFSWDDSYVAVCLDNDILVIFIGNYGASKADNLVLKGHESCVNCAEFGLHHPTLLVSVADDRTFIIWDVTSSSVLHRCYLPLLTSVPVALAMNCAKENVTIGSADGHLLIIDLSFSNSSSNRTEMDRPFRIIRSADCSKMVTRTLNSGSNSETNKQTLMTRSLEDSDLSHNTVDGNCVISSLTYCYSRRQDQYSFNSKSKKKNSADKPHFITEDSFFENLNQSQLLIVGTTNAIFCINADTLECIAFVDLLLFRSELLGDLNTLSLMVCVQQTDSLYVSFLTANSFSDTLNISRMRLPCDTVTNETSRPPFRDYQETPTHLPETSVRNCVVYPSAMLTVDSVLKTELVPKRITKKDKKKNSSFEKNKNAMSGDKPLTFKDRVKSSGYSVTLTHRAMFTPNTSVPKAKNCSRKSDFKTRTTVKNYDSSTVVHNRSYLQVSDNSAAITCIKMSSNGKKLAVGSRNSSVTVLKSSLTDQGSCFLGHKKAINSVDWSYDDEWLITSSGDNTASVWETGKTVPLMTFTKIKSNFDCGRQHVSGMKQTICFEKEINKAQFYYMDNFILLASGGSFYLYSYHLDPTREDVRSYLTKSRYKLVKSFQTESNIVTDLAAINSFYSYVCVCVTSDRSLSAYDMNVGQIVQVIPESHTTAPYCVAMNAGSSQLSLPPNAYDIVLTAAVTDCVKLWDLRSDRCVRRLEQHHNRAYTCRAAFSPCGKYVMAGSEDYTAYLYDVGEGTCCAKLTRHSDVVTDVAYHPFQPRVATATLNGRLYVFDNHQR